MPQISLYLDKVTHENIRLAAEREKKSVSSWAGKYLADAAKPEGFSSEYLEFLRTVDIDIERPPQGNLADDSPRIAL